MLYRSVTLVKIVVTMHNNKNSLLKLLKVYLQLRHVSIKFLNIKPMAVLKMETKKLIKN